MTANLLPNDIAISGNFKIKTRKPRMYPENSALDSKVETKPSEILENAQDENLEQMEKKVVELSFENFTKFVENHES